MTEMNQLRNAAEAALAKQPVTEQAPEDMLRQAHELPVHRIELEMQNDELLRTQVQLEESQARYFDLYDLAPVGYLTLSEAGQILQANLTAASLLGVIRSKLLKRPLSRFIHQLDQPIYYKHRCGMVGASVAMSCELRMSKPDGSPFWASLTSIATHHAAGEPACRVIINDITASKRRETELRASEEKFRAIANYTVDWESWFGVDGRYLWVNPSVECLTGYAPAEVLAMPDFIDVLVVEADRERFRRYFQEALHGVPGAGLEFCSCHKDGFLHWLSVSWQSIFDAGGHCVGVRSSTRDITKQKRLDDMRTFLARTSSGTDVESFFHALASNLAGSLGMDYVCICRLEGDGLKARSLVVWRDGHFEDNVTCAVKSGPCGEVLGQAACCFPEGVSRRFPHDEVIRDLGAESYIGCTLLSHNGEPIGLIAAIGRRPLTERTQAEAILTMVAERAASELERQAGEDKLRDYQRLLSVIIDNSPSQVFAFDLQHRFILLNDELARFYGLSKEEVWGKSIAEVFPSEVAAELMAANSRITTRGEPLHLEEVITSHISDEPRTVMSSKFALRNLQGDITGLGGVVTDVTNYKNALDALRQSLGEKVSMLKEIHHRVKNNLQIVSSLLRLQSGRVSSAGTRAALLDMEGRIHSMALIHEHLYRSDNLAAVDLAAYLTQLSNHLLRTLVLTPGTVQLHLNLSHMVLEIDQAVPCGLLVNELVSNALKHAFPDGRKGELWVLLDNLADGVGWHLRVADNGVGLPPDLDLEHITTLGLKLVSDLSRQLGASLSFGSGPGAVFEVICQPRGE